LNDDTNFHIKYGPAKMKLRNISTGQDEGLVLGFRRYSVALVSSEDLAISFHNDSMCPGLIFEMPNKKH